MPKKLRETVIYLQLLVFEVISKTIIRLSCICHAYCIGTFIKNNGTEKININNYLYKVITLIYDAVPSFEESLEGLLSNVKGGIRQSNVPPPSLSIL